MVQRQLCCLIGPLVGRPLATFVAVLSGSLLGLVCMATVLLLLLRICGYHCFASLQLWFHLQRCPHTWPTLRPHLQLLPCGGACLLCNGRGAGSMLSLPCRDGPIGTFI